MFCSAASLQLVYTSLKYQSNLYLSVAVLYQ